MTRGRKSPFSRWTSQHAGRISPEGGRRPKLWHSTEEKAQAHAAKVNEATYEGREVWIPYPCRWGAHHLLGESAELHWHIGRTSQKSGRG